MAADRTLMAWIRTSLSMLSFGFTIYKVSSDTAVSKKEELAQRRQPAARQALFLTGHGEPRRWCSGRSATGTTLKDLNRTEEFRLGRRPTLLVAAIMTLARGRRAVPQHPDPCGVSSTQGTPLPALRSVRAKAESELPSTAVQHKRIRRDHGLRNTARKSAVWIGVSVQKMRCGSRARPGDGLRGCLHFGHHGPRIVVAQAPAELTIISHDATHIALAGSADWRAQGGAST